MKGVLRSLMVSLWFMFLTFPLLVIKVSTIDGAVVWRFENALYLGTAIFILSFIWRALLVLKGISTPEEADMAGLFAFLQNPRNKNLAIGLGTLGLSCLPFLLSVLQTFGSAKGLQYAAIGGFVLALAGIALALARTRFTGIGLGLALAGCMPAAVAAYQALSAGQDAVPFPVQALVGFIIAAIGLAVAVPSLAGRREEAVAAYKAAAGRLAEPGLPRAAVLTALLLLLLPLPYMLDIYRINVLATAFVWIMLGLGLNIVVGQAGLLVLGYVAFYAVGAYTYAIGNMHFGNDLIGFWTFLPLGGLFAALAGILLSLPVLRLRGDYLAIVTLGFGEIVRVTLEGGSLSLAPLAWVMSLFTDAPPPAWLTAPLNLGGPAGIGGIPYPGFFGMKLSMDDSIRFVYYIALGLALLTMVAVARLRDSRIGRAWIALREDEIACEAMGVNKVAAKLSAFALGACWAGFGGVLFASKTTFINPTSFTFMESALILSVVVLGGLGSILGVALGACVLILLPEYLRSFNEYRMLIFGASMVLMMVFRPQGLIMPKAKKRIIAGVNDGTGKKKDLTLLPPVQTAPDACAGRGK